MSTGNPFPGMDPYLESRWGDFHTCLILFARRRLRDQLPDGLVARIEEYVSLYLADEDRPDRFKPDVRMVESESTLALDVVDETEVAVAEPIVVPRALEPETLRVLQVVDTKSGERVVTTIEFLSPANKSFGGAAEFREKQEKLLRGGVNVVEVDLLRSGHPALSVPEESIPEETASPYRACVVEAGSPHVGSVYQFGLREPLPGIAIPLRETDAPSILPLQPVVDEAYVEGRNSDIDYTRDPSPPLVGDDAVWADELLKTKGLR